MNAVVLLITHNYPSIIKNCGWDWFELFEVACFKLCYELSTQFEHLNSIIIGVTNYQISCFVNWQALGLIEFPVFFPFTTEFIQKITVSIKYVYTLKWVWCYSKVFIFLNAVTRITFKFVRFAKLLQKMAAWREDLDWFAVFFSNDNVTITVYRYTLRRV